MFGGITYFMGIQEWPGSKTADGQGQEFWTKYTK